MLGDYRAAAGERERERERERVASAGTVGGLQMRGGSALEAGVHK